MGVGGQSRELWLSAGKYMCRADDPRALDALVAVQWMVPERLVPAAQRKLWPTARYVMGVPPERAAAPSAVGVDPMWYALKREPHTTHPLNVRDAFNWRPGHFSNVMHRLCVSGHLPPLHSTLRSLLLTGMFVLFVERSASGTTFARSAEAGGIRR
jgi:hypothetical protein